MTAGLLGKTVEKNGKKKIERVEEGDFVVLAEVSEILDMLTGCNEIHSNECFNKIWSRP